MILTIIILTVLFTLSLIFALFCWLHYQALRRYIEVNQQILIQNNKLFLEYIQGIYGALLNIDNSLNKPLEK
jgi:hypothetical protein